jgi:hypothetical protein
MDRQGRREGDRVKWSLHSVWVTSLPSNIRANLYNKKGAHSPPHLIFLAHAQIAQHIRRILIVRIMFVRLYSIWTAARTWRRHVTSDLFRTHELIHLALTVSVHVEKKSCVEEAVVVRDESVVDCFVCASKTRKSEVEQLCNETVTKCHQK